jgi:hypothetical protein
MICIPSNKRITAQQALQHEYFQVKAPNQKPAVEQIQSISNEG